MRHFRWLAIGPIPAVFDLRRLGWQLLDGSSDQDHIACPQLVNSFKLPLRDWLTLTASPPARRKLTMMVGVDDPDERVRLLRIGIGEALSSSVSLAEIELRAVRLSIAAAALPDWRLFGALRLNLLAREAYVGGRALGLHPREFALLWRLSDVPGDPVAPATLIRDVWRMSFRPETNSLAVHISRLRAKLRLAGLDGMIQTLRDGAYRLGQDCTVTPRTAVPHHLPLDAHAGLGKETH